jgi:hypothetical protein
MLLFLRGCKKGLEHTRGTVVAAHHAMLHTVKQEGGGSLS